MTICQATAGHLRDDRNRLGLDLGVHGATSNSKFAMAASFSTIAPPAWVLSNTEDVSDRIGAIEISRIDGESEAILISACGT
jgi:hypothetical protein